MIWLGLLALFVILRGRSASAAKPAPQARDLGSPVQGAPIFNLAQALAGRHAAVDLTYQTSGTSTSGASTGTSSTPGTGSAPGTSGGEPGGGELFPAAYQGLGYPYYDPLTGTVTFSRFVFPGRNASDPNTQINEIDRIAWLADLQSMIESGGGSGGGGLVGSPELEYFG